MMAWPSSERMTRSKASTGEDREAVRIWLLGTFRVSVADRTIEEGSWRLRKAANLVKQLALASGHRLHREQAMDLLWPDLGRRAASNNLRRVLHAARRVLDPTAGSHYLVSQDDSIALCPGGDLWVDVEAFEEAAATAHRSRNPAAHRAALDLYAGELLPSDRYEVWVEDRREQLRRTYLTLLLELGGLYEERGEYGRAIGTLRTVVAEEPANEEGHAGLMRIYAGSNRQAEAFAQYERLYEVLSKKLGAEPSNAIHRLREEIAGGTFQSAGIPGHLQEEPTDASKHNLPPPRTSFVGREREIVEIKRALAMTRLLTLTGAGGSGKTRLALEVARDLVGIYEDGVWFVELAPLTEGELVPQAVAQIVGVSERPGQPLVDTLAEILRVRELLLVLDNCEHLVDAAAGLADTVLNSCPEVRVLATSREALNIAGETNRPVSPLIVPALQSEPTVEELEGAESVRLYVERAQHRNPSFTLTTENARAVAEICRWLDGMPLAIELAAVRTGAMSVEQISERLKSSFRLLNSGSRMTTLRQRTLQGALDWSHDLLKNPERVLFRRLSAFMGGWTLEEAEVVGAGNSIGKCEVLELLSGLVDKSLIVAGVTGGGAARYRMLELIRQYALEKLDESGEAEAVKRRHAEYFLALAEESEPCLRESEQERWLGRLETEYDNMRTALSWALECCEAELGLRLAGALEPFWDGRGYYDEGRRWLEEALKKGGRLPARAKALEKLGWLAYDQGDLDRAVEVAEEGLKLGDEVEIENCRTARFRDILGNVARIHGDFEGASILFEESLALYQEAGDEWGIARSLLQLGRVAVGRGDHERAIELYEEGLSLSRKSGYAAMLPLYLIDLGYEFLLQGDHGRAAALNEEALALYRERGRRGNRVAGLGEHAQTALNNLGWVELARGDYERAQGLYVESLELSKELGDKLVAAKSIEGLACVAGTREAESAAKLFGAARMLREAIGYYYTPIESAMREPYLVRARSRLGEVAWEAAFDDGQVLTSEEAIEYALQSKEPTTTLSTTPEPQQSVVLTRREQEVAALVARGLSNRQIASTLSISEHTAATHVRRILKKLGFKSRAQIGTWLAGRQDRTL